MDCVPFDCASSCLRKTSLALQRACSSFSLHFLLVSLSFLVLYHLFRYYRIIATLYGFGTLWFLLWIETKIIALSFSGLHSIVLICAIVAGNKYAITTLTLITSIFKLYWRFNGVWRIILRFFEVSRTAIEFPSISQFAAHSLPF